MTKLILLEGIPGSGKSTFARKIAEWYQNRYETVDLYIEGQWHPADLGWIACIPVAKYNELLQQFSGLSEDITRNTIFEGDVAMVAYTLVVTENKDFYAQMEAFEVYDGRVPDELFFALHYRRWRSFAEKAASNDTRTIFECAFLQNHVNELLFWRNADEAAVIQHHQRLADTVACLSPTLIYLSQPDVRETITRVAQERVSTQHGNWIDRCAAYCENSPFGKRRNSKGFEGVIDFFTLRKQLEMKILPQLSMPYRIIENIAYDWDDVWTKIENYLQELEGM